MMLAHAIFARLYEAFVKIVADKPGIAFEPPISTELPVECA